MDDRLDGVDLARRRCSSPSSCSMLAGHDGLRTASRPTIRASRLAADADDARRPAVHRPARRRLHPPRLARHRRRETHGATGSCR